MSSILIRKTGVTFCVTINIMIRMANNLDEMIRRSGLKKHEVAKLKGVTPETLSRHVHEKVPMTTRDAKEYAQILDCYPQQILYRSEPIPLLGSAHIGANGDNTYVIDQIKKGWVYMDSVSYKDYAAIQWTVDKEYKGKQRHYKNAVELISRKGIDAKIVDNDVIQNIGWAKLKNQQIIYCGYVYPEPDDLYTVKNYETNSIHQNLELEWAVPSLSLIIRPDIRNMEIVYKTI